MKLPLLHRGAHCRPCDCTDRIPKSPLQPPILLISNSKYKHSVGSISQFNSHVKTSKILQEKNRDKIRPFIPTFGTRDSLLANPLQLLECQGQSKSQSSCSFPVSPDFQVPPPSAVWAGALNLGFMNTPPANCRRIIHLSSKGERSQMFLPGHQQNQTSALDTVRPQSSSQEQDSAPASPGSHGNCPGPCQAGDAVKHPELTSESGEPHTNTPHHPLVTFWVHPPTL